MPAAYSLWTSPITGYRRRGTRLTELRGLLEAGITARAIMEPLQSCPAGSLAIEMTRILRQKGFDVAGVRETHEGPVIGYVSKESLQNGVVRDHLRMLTTDLLVSDATPLPSLLSVLKSRERAFVLVRSEVTGIVTRADLNKPPVRVYLFGLVSLLEMHLTFWVRAYYPDDSWKQCLATRRLEKAEQLLSDRRARKQDTGLINCLQFCDKRDLVLARQELLDSLEIGAAPGTRAFLKRAEDLRNGLAHSQEYLVKGAAWSEVIDVVEWVEGVVEKSDGLVEREAGKAASTVQDELWGSA